jgi:hypothetical protein
MDVGCERLLANMAAINNFDGLKYSGNLMITGYISNAIRPRQSIGGSCGTMKMAIAGFCGCGLGGQWSHDTLTRTIC